LSKVAVLIAGVLMRVILFSNSGSGNADSSFFAPEKFSFYFLI
jgi:hypothetical protein